MHKKVIMKMPPSESLGSSTVISLTLPGQTNGLNKPETRSIPDLSVHLQLPSSSLSIIDESGNHESHSNSVSAKSPNETAQRQSSSTTAETVNNHRTFPSSSNSNSNSSPSSNWINSLTAKWLCIDCIDTLPLPESANVNNHDHDRATNNDNHDNPNDNKNDGQSLQLVSMAAYRSFLLSEVSGALGDIGTFIPILVSLSNSSQINLTASLVLGGLFHIVVALIFKIPVSAIFILYLFILVYTSFKYVTND
jgi:hypothetical protein